MPLTHIIMLLWRARMSADIRARTECATYSSSPNIRVYYCCKVLYGYYESRLCHATPSRDAATLRAVYAPRYAMRLDKNIRSLLPRSAA